MLSSLKQGSTIYILKKADTPTLLIGQVVSVSQPTPTYQGNIQYGTLPKTTISISAKVGEETYNFEKLDSSLSLVTDGNGLVVSESRDLMSAEVENMLAHSHAVLESVEYHKRVVESCDKMLKDLNPRFKKEREQEEKIDSLEKRLGGMEGTLTDIQDMLTKALGGKSKNLRKNDDDTD